VRAADRRPALPCPQIIFDLETKEIPMKTSIAKFSSRLVLSLGVTAFTFTASAALAEENALILIDQSGSMNALSTPVLTKRAVAKTMAHAFVDEFHADREYALWTFRNSSYTEVIPFSAHATKAEVHAAIDALVMPSGSTPMAKAICDAVDSLIAYEADDPSIPDKRIVLLSDGLENSTPNFDQCYGPPSTSVPPADFTVNSWQWKVLNKARTGSATVAIDPFPFHVIIDVDALFQFIPTAAMSSFAAGPGPSLPGPVMPGPIPTPGIIPSPQIPPIEILPTLTVGSAIPITAPLVKGHPGLPFYAKLTGQTTGRYREIDGTKPLPQLGDITGDSCVDSADVQKVSASFGQTVARGSKADLNRDRKVDFYDYLTVVQNMGEGCTK
jgi:hypothetical protein